MPSIAFRAPTETRKRCGRLLTGLVLGLLTLGGCDSKDATTQRGGAGATSRDEQDPASSSTPSQPIRRASPPARPASLRQGRSAFEQGRVDEALAVAKQHLIANPKDAAALTLAADCFLQQQQPQQAIEMFRAVDPKDAQYGLNALGQLGDLLIQQARPDEAAQVFAQLIRFHGEIPLAHSRLAMLLNSRGMRFESVPHLRALAELDNITLRELSALVTIADQCAVGKVPGTTGTDKDPVLGDLRRARQLNMGGKNAESRKLCERLRAGFPDSTAVAAFMGRVLIDDQDVEALTRWHSDLPDGIESQPLYWNTLARWMMLEGDHQGAVHAALRSAELDPTSADTYEAMAYGLRAMGKSDAVQVVEERAEQLRQTKRINQRFLMDQTDASDFLRMSELMLDLQRPFESVAWFKESLKRGGQTEKARAFGARLQSYQPPENLQQWTLCQLQPDRFEAPDLSRIARQQPAADPRTDDQSDGADAIRLTDVASRLGIEFSYDPGDSHLGRKEDSGAYFLHQTMGGGIGVLDYDRDGWADVYFSQAGGDAFGESALSNALFRSQAATSFVDVIGPSGANDFGYGQGVAAVDFNQDGWTDLVVANIGVNRAFRNNGDGTFQRVPLPAWQDKVHWTSQVACADLDGDALPDWIECNYIDDPRAFEVRCTETEQHCAPAEFTPARNRFLRCADDGSFESWTGGGKGSTPNYSLGVVVSNLDGLHGNDVFVANDTRENELWISEATKTDPGRSSVFELTEQARLRGCATGSLGELQGCMGIATGDFDHDGSFDLYVTNYFNEPSNFYLQRDAGLFVDSAARFKLRSSSVPMVGFGTQAADLDADGWLDLLVLNGHAVDRRDKGEPLKMKPQLYRGREGAFAEVSSSGYWDQPRLGRTLASWDFDRDGMTDFLANHLQSPVAVLHNETPSGNWIQIELVGVQSERDATGARVVAEFEGGSATAWRAAGDGYFCTNESVVALGLGEASAITRIEISWPSGRIQELFSVRPNRRYLVIEGINTLIAR